MKIYKKEVEKYLSSFSGEFREIFFEKSKTFRFSCLNGVWRTPVFSELDGMSILSRSGNKEYFQVFGGCDEADKKIQNFKKQYALGVGNGDISLSGESELELLESNEISFELSEIISSIQKVFEEQIYACSIIASSDISLNISRKSFIVGNSDGNFSSDVNFYNTLFVVLIGEKDGKREEIYEKITGTDILKRFSYEEIKSSISHAIEVLKNQLDGIGAPNGKIDVIIGNEAGGTIIHEAVGHGLEADLQNSSVYKGKIGEKVASELVTIVDNPTRPKERGFYLYDHEGYAANNTILIEKGILKSYLHNAKTAQKFEVSSTGHGRKESYKYKSLVRMGNTYMMPGTDKKEDLIAKVSYGLYVSRMGGGQVNTTTGDFVFKVQNGYLIENGKLTKNVRGATLSGNGPEMLQEIYGVCDDLNFFDGGTCGKGQSMPVSDATPTILTKLKVSGVD